VYNYKFFSFEINVF